MLETLIVVLVILWALGFFGGFVVSQLVHVLLVVALLLIVVRLAKGQSLL